MMTTNDTTTQFLNDTLQTQMEAPPMSVFYIDVIGQPIIFTACLVFLILLTIAKRLRKQPVRDKNFLFVIVTARMISCIFQILPSIPQVYPYRCLVHPLGVFPLNFTALFIYFVITIQVLVDMRVQALKQDLYVNSVKDSAAIIPVPPLLRLLKFFSSRFFAAAIYVLLIALSYALNAALYFVVANQNCQYFGTLARFAVVSINVVWAFMMMLVIAIDMWYAKREFCQRGACLRPFTQDDPLAYRIELLATFVFLCMFCIETIALTFVQVPLALTGSIIKLSIDVMALLVLPTISLVAVLVNECKYRKMTHARKESIQNLINFNPTVETIHKIIEDPIVSVMFREFASKEFCVENVIFYEQVQLFKSKPSIEFAKKIIAMFIHSDAPYEINVPEKAKLIITQAMEEYEKSKQFDVTLFDKSEYAVIFNLLDMYNRFYSSSAFREYTKTAVAP